MFTPQAGPCRLDRQQPEDDVIDLNARASRALDAACERVGGAKSGPAARLRALLYDLVKLRRLRGCSETELRAVELCVAGVIDDLCSPVGDVDLRVLRRMESDADRAEDAAQDLLGIEGGDAALVLVEDYARRLEKQASASLTLARAWRAHARRMRSDRETMISVSKDRLGISHRNG